MIRASDAAKYFLVVQGAVGAAAPITNLKLQKLCYYAQGFALGKLGKPLFGEDIERWQYGPAIRSVDRQYNRFRNKPIPVPDSLELSLFPPEVRDILNMVIQEHGPKSASVLLNQTHEESPWKDYSGGGFISHQQLRDHFGPLMASKQSSGPTLVDRMQADTEFMALGPQAFESERRISLEDLRREARRCLDAVV